ncbi:MAG: HD domain-containing protein [Lachnospiraceae bacterium]|nr:HD domain-containing protein [Lachnospiraceae bacterium]
MNFDARIPSGAVKILHKLKEAGYEAYIVGGCVRDCLLGKQPSDWDITTSAKPQEVKDIFRRTVDTGLQHGTVSVLMREEGKLCAYEVTTYRIDGAYEDGRHPKQVTFTPDLSEDLRRRDFTINAMAYNPEDGLVDLHGGREDLEKRLIRCVGDPKERFGEDALRMMRAIRFAAQLDATIDPAAWEAICAMKDNIVHVSAERIRVELEKLLVSPRPALFALFVDCGLAEHFLPEFLPCMGCTQENPHHQYNVGEHILHSLETIDTARLREELGEEAYPRALKTLRLTMLFHDIGKPGQKTVDEAGIAHFKGHPEKSAQIAECVLRRLKYDNDTIRDVVHLVATHEERFPAKERSLRRAMSSIGAEYFPLYFYVQQADALAQSLYQREEKLARLEELRELRKIILKKQCPLSVRDLAVNGADLKAAGVTPGPGMGELLKRMLEDVLEEPSHNTKEYLLRKYC